MFKAGEWKDYEVIDASDGEKLERWGEYLLVRPDPQVIWTKHDFLRGVTPHARYIRSPHGGGEWEYIKKLPESWQITYKDLTFKVRPTGFKHTGLFPEQAANWDWLAEKIKKAGRQVNVLNLFAYTGGATLACANAGATVCHVDAARGMVAQARENAQLSGLEKAPTRYIVDDCSAFVSREIRRNRRYDAVIMDPPSYGRGPKGEVWKLEDELFSLVELCCDVLSDNPLLFLINSYTTGLQPAVLNNILQFTLAKKFGGNVKADELVLPIRSGGVLPCGASGRWSSDI
ncbi:MAG TPA: class I SAM-dependent methyltransferase [Clostridia bacterium]|nr:class I SAM-dependent methyltransferase [Clostridia bacterium]